MFKRKKNKTGIDRERLALSLYEKEPVKEEKAPDSVDDTKIAEKLSPNAVKIKEEKPADKKRTEKKAVEKKSAVKAVPVHSDEDEHDREEIFSTASKKVRLTTQNPLDEQSDDDEKQASNTRELFEILEFLDKVQSDEPKTPTAGETDAQGYKIDDGEVPKLQNTIELERIRAISRQLNEENAGRQRAKHDSDEERTITAPSRNAKDDDRVVTAGTPVKVNPEEKQDQHIDETPIVSISVGKFSQVVRSQYEEYMRYNEKAAQVAKITAQNMTEEDEDDEPIFPYKIKRKQNPEKQKPEKIKKKISFTFGKAKTIKTYYSDFEEYTEKTDKRRFYRELAQKSQVQFGRALFLLVVSLISLVLFVLEKFSPATISFAGDNSPLLFCIINLVLIIISGIVCAETIVSGLKGLIKNMGNCDTGVSIAYIAVMLQGIVAVFNSKLFFDGKMELYSALLAVALLLNSLAKYSMLETACSNLLYLVSPKRKYAVKKYDDKFLKSKMLSGVSSDKNTLVYQRKTGFINGALNNQYRANRGLLFMNRIALPLAILALIVAIIYGTLLDGGIFGAVSAFAVMCLACIPVSGFAVIQSFIKRVCKATLKVGAMITGYGAYKSVSSCGAVTVDIRALYPRGALSLKGIKTFSGQRLDEAIINAAAVATAAGGPIADIFTSIVKGNVNLPIADSVIYEDEKGMIGWVNGERVLVGSAELLNEHGIDTPSKDYESKFTTDGGCITYVANAGILEAMFITKYRPEIRIARALQALEDSRTAILIRTVDENITADKVAEDFGLYHRSVKVLPTGLGNAIKQEASEEDESSDSAISTSGSFVSFAHAVANSKRLGSCIRLIVALQLISLALGVCLVAVLVFCAGIGRLGTVELLVYFLFWALAMLISPLFLKS